MEQFQQDCKLAIQKYFSTKTTSFVYLHKGPFVKCFNDIQIEAYLMEKFNKDQAIGIQLLNRFKTDDTSFLLD